MDCDRLRVGQKVEFKLNGIAHTGTVVDITKSRKKLPVALVASRLGTIKVGPRQMKLVQQ